MFKSFFQGLIHTASLTTQGKIRTADGQLYYTPTKWLSTLGLNLKKKQAYQKV